MNIRQKELWSNLMTLVDEHEDFFYADRSMNGVWFRIFNYRLASYERFKLPDALECRGHMFEISEEGIDAEPIALSSWAFPKFFNYLENPFTMNLDLSTIVEVAEKLDGSLISTYMIGDDLFLKTKGSLESDQALAAMKWLDSPEQKALKDELTQIGKLDACVHMEWVSPDNRIVLSYENCGLRVLGIRSNESGLFTYFEDIDGYHFPNVLSIWAKIEQVTDLESFVTGVRDMEGIEGFVCRMKDGQFFKLKCEQYVTLHHAKDSVNHPRRLYDVVLENATDDLRSLFIDDPAVLEIIADMEIFVAAKYNHIVDTVERFYERNKHIDRKDYAILGQGELGKMYFGLAMQRYLGNNIDYKEFMKKHYKSILPTEKQEPI